MKNIRLKVMLEKLLEPVSVSLLLSLLVFAAAAALVSTALLNVQCQATMMTVSNNKMILRLSREEDTVDNKTSLLLITMVEDSIEQQPSVWIPTTVEDTVDKKPSSLRTTTVEDTECFLHIV